MQTMKLSGYQSFFKKQVVNWANTCIIKSESCAIVFMKNVSVICFRLHLCNRLCNLVERLFK